MDFSLFLAASAAVNRFVAVIKPWVRQIPIGEQVQDVILIAVSCLVGVFLAASAGLNLLGEVVNLPDWAEVVITGGLIGAGADVLNGAIDLLYGWRDKTRE